MKVSVRAFPVNNAKVKNILANLDITFEDSLVVRATLRDGENPWVAFPQRSYTDADGATQYIDMTFPITKELREEVTAASNLAFAKALEEAEKPAPKKKSYYRK